MNKQVKGWASEFGLDFQVPPEITVRKELLVDTSWHNDVCPSFTAGKTLDGFEITLWVNHIDPAQREIQGNERFIISVDENPQLEWSTDDVQAAIERVRAYNLLSSNSVKQQDTAVRCVLHNDE